MRDLPLLVHSPNACNGWSWANQKPEVRIFFYFPHIDAGSWELEPLSAALSGHIRKWSNQDWTSAYTGGWHHRHWAPGDFWMASACGLCWDPVVRHMGSRAARWIWIKLSFPPESWVPCIHRLGSSQTDGHLAWEPFQRFFCKSWLLLPQLDLLPQLAFHAYEW